jgi:predicted nucleic acid-binding Zn ribbon protein
MTGSKEDTLVPFPTYRCDDCGHVNLDFALFDEDNKTNLIQ